MPYKFNGKEMDEKTGLYYYGARYMNPVASIWYGVDPLAEKYVATGGYVYTLDNPVKLVDPDGEHLEVYKNYNEKNGYSIVGGKVDNDLNVYENYGLPNQKIIGRMLTKYSFMDEKIETAVEGVQIELGDNFGQKFINKMERNTPSVIDYSLNAYGGQTYDFKNVGAPKHVPTKSVVRYQHRGMLVNVNGEEYIASARDIGNYVAAKNGLAWGEARLGFDGLETEQHIKGAWHKMTLSSWKSIRNFLNTSRHWYVEGHPTFSAERLGFDTGSKTFQAQLLQKVKMRTLPLAPNRFIW